jgi:SAM-dependent methyltransferase
MNEILPPSPKSSDAESDNPSAKNNPIIKAFVQDQAKEPNNFNSTIHRNDEMFLFALQYFKGNMDHACIELLSTGKQGMDVIRQIIQWNFEGFHNVSSFLDFASGYGRLTRFLVQELPPNCIYVCDIYADAVEFQQKQFGVHGIVSAHGPEDFHDSRKYDCIFVASLFSHLPKTTFFSWLKRLYDLLSTNGILIFSVHDVAVLPPHLKMEEEGLLFIPLSESRSLAANNYGSTYVTEKFVSNMINEITGKSSYYRMKKGLWWFQDIYIISKNPNGNFADFEPSPGPMGYVEQCILNTDNEIYLNGWAVDFSKNTFIKEIQIIINGKIALRCLPSLDRPDIAEAFQDDRSLKSGFSCHLKKDALALSDIMIAKVINSRNIEHVIRIGTLESFMGSAKA